MDIRPPVHSSEEPRIGEPHRSRTTTVVIVVLILLAILVGVYFYLVRSRPAPALSPDNITYPLTPESRLKVLDELNNATPTNGAEPLSGEETVELLDTLADKGGNKKSVSTEERQRILEDL